MYYYYKCSTNARGFLGGQKEKEFNRRDRKELPQRTQTVQGADKDESQISAEFLFS
jgi:hypothetical protein